jgi:hypothetical protein
MTRSRRIVWALVAVLVYVFVGYYGKPLIAAVRAFEATSVY